jgi:chemotaxis methyl-accepting protein methylase
VDEQKRLVGKFINSLKPGGYLVLGHSESIQGWNTGLQFVYNNGGTAYKKPRTEVQ